MLLLGEHARVLVLGGTGAVGAATLTALRDRGHAAVAASRSSEDAEQRVRLDLGLAEGRARLAELAPQFDVIVNTSGREDASVLELVGGTPFVDTSAGSRYLEALGEAARVRSEPATVVLGAGIAPGATTLLAASFDPRPGVELDVAVLLGTGETHGPAAVAWTAALAGEPIHRAPEGTAVLNYRERRSLRVAGCRDTYLRTDFPDHVLLAARGATIRSYLTLGGALANGGLALVGAVPRLRGLLAAAPHWGSDAWRVAVQHRGTGETRYVGGFGQSRATGEFAALAALAAAERPALGAVSMAEVMDTAVFANVAAVTSRG